MQSVSFAAVVHTKVSVSSAAQLGHYFIIIISSFIIKVDIRNFYTH